MCWCSASFCWVPCGSVGFRVVSAAAHDVLAVRGVPLSSLRFCWVPWSSGSSAAAQDGRVLKGSSSPSLVALHATTCLSLYLELGLVACVPSVSLILILFGCTPSVLLSLSGSSAPCPPIPTLRPSSSCLAPALPSPAVTLCCVAILDWRNSVSRLHHVRPQPGGTSAPAG